MANKYIVRRPIKDTISRVIGYEILYHGENTAYGGDSEPGQRSKVNEFAVAETIHSFLTQNTERIKDSLNFMTFTTTLLMKKVPHLFAKEDLVIQIDDSVIIHPLAMHFVQMYKKEGYRIAVNDFQFAPRYVSLIDQIDYIKLDFSSLSEDSLHNLIEIANGMGKHCIAYNVNTEDLYQLALKLGVTELEGDAVAEKLASKAHDSSYLQSSFFQLLSAVTREEPDIAEIEHIISMDASLTYALLRVANTVQFATRNRTTSVHQAIMNIGITQLQQWIYLLCASNDQGEVDPFFEEFLKLSFMRANFCASLLGYTKKVPISKNDAYLLGMFSTLDYLVDAPLEETLEQVAISDEIKDALLNWGGPAGALYALMLSYESADWDKVSKLCDMLGIAPNMLTTLYFECMEQANEVWENVNRMSGSDD
ncbi:MAG: HDOD domain-containing protein [Ruminococcaceae bacterium]|jgi:EAL and modified HD-GYP domain-containing signal transduction protein|nr:HDOD domain-containing protein [Oscillospiraceae bacterium]